VPLEAINEFVVDVDEGDFVAGREGPGHLLSQDTGAGDDCPHWPSSLLRKLLRRLVALDATTKLIRSLASMVVSEPGMIERPPRVTSTT